MTDSTDSVIITDQYRVPVIAQKRTDSETGVVLRGHFHHVLILSEAELDRLFAFVNDEPPRARIQRYVVNAPESP